MTDFELMINLSDQASYDSGKVPLEKKICWLCCKKWKIRNRKYGLERRNLRWECHWKKDQKYLGWNHLHAVHIFGTLSQGRWPLRPSRRVWGLSSVFNFISAVAVWIEGICNKKWMPLEKRSDARSWVESSARKAVRIFGTLSQGRWARRPGRGAWGLFPFSISFLLWRFAEIFTYFWVGAQKLLLWRV